MQDVGVEHAETTRRCGSTDRLRLVGAVYAIEGVSKIECHRPEWVLQATGHLDRETAVPLAHLGRWMPIGPVLLAADRLGPGPVEAFAANRDRVFVGASIGQD